MKKLLLTLLVLAAFSVTPALAVKVSSLYQAETLVPAQSDELRAQAVKEGFVQVLQKLTGDAEIEKNSQIKQSLKKPDYYVQEFTYSLPSASSAQYLLKIRYNADDVNRLLKRTNVPYWGENRPLILVWLAVANPQQTPEIMGNEAPGDLSSDMKQASKKFGLPLIFPMMDMMDVSQVSPNDVTAMALPLLKEAGKRYSPDALLIGSMTVEGRGVQSQWSLVLNESEWKWTIAERTTEDVIAAVLNQVGQTLAKHYVTKSQSAPQQWLTLEVTHVVQRSDLAELMQYLKQLNPVQRVALSQVSGDVVQLSVLVQGSLASFQQHAAIDQHLVLKLEDNTHNKLIYEWVP